MKWSITPNGVSQLELSIKAKHHKKIHIFERRL